MTISERTPAPDIRPRLAFGRTVWLALVALSAALTLAGLPLRLAELQQPCLLEVTACSNRLWPTATEIGQMASNGLPLESFALILTGSSIVSSLVFFALGAVIFARRARDRGALVTSLALALFGTNNLMWQALGERFPATQTLASILFAAQLIMFGLLFATFPSGRVVPRAMWLVIALWSLYAIFDAFATFGTLAGAPADALANIAWPTMLIGGAASQVYRYARVSSVEERKQTKWVVFGLFLLVTFVVLVGLFSLDVRGVSAGRLIFQVATTAAATVCIAVPVGIAVLRQGLYDIDLILRRTVTYAIISAALTLVYFGANLAVQSVIGALGGQRNEIAIVASTLAVAALFLPVRRRVQEAIDRRFNRQRYDADRVVADFADYAARETDLIALQARIVGVVADTIQPKQVTVWVKGASLGDE